MESLSNPELSNYKDLPPLFDYDSFDLPNNTELDLYFVYHGKAVDLGEPRQLHKLLKKADVHIPEQPEWEPRHIELLQRISNGDKNISSKMTQKYESAGMTGKLGNPTFYKRLFSEMLGTNCIVLCADIHDKHPIVNDNRQAAGLVPWPFDFGEALETAREFFSFMTKVNIVREQTILSNIAKVTEIARQSRPKLRDRPAKILMWAGVMHEPVGAALNHKKKLEQNSGNDPQFSINTYSGLNNEIEAPYFTQVYERLVRGLKIDDELVARAMISHYMWTKPIPEKLTSYEADVVRRTDLEDLTLSELEALFNEAVELSANPFHPNNPGSESSRQPEL